MDDYFFEPEEPWEPPRDRKIDDAKVALMAFFKAGSTAVYYGRQLEIALEDRFFHWITRKALNELAEERRIGYSEESLGSFVAHFYWERRHRYARRQIAASTKLIQEFSDPEFTAALGATGEQLADGGFATLGFRVVARNVREFRGRRWEETNHDLDRLVVRDGVPYGVEIKNRLPYIEQKEFEAKLSMCRHLEVKPLFIARMMPANYMNQVWRAGGFSLLLKNQHYPLLAGRLARQVRADLGLPVLCIRSLPDTTMKRFESWHSALPTEANLAVCRGPRAFRPVGFPARSRRSRLSLSIVDASP